MKAGKAKGLTRFEMNNPGLNNGDDLMTGIDVIARSVNAGDILDAGC
jgi:hypothetical protein